MNAREELAALLGKHYGTSAGSDDYLWAMADIIMAKGWAKHQAIEEVADLDALPVGSVVLDVDGGPWKKRKDGLWLGLRNELEPSVNVYWTDSEVRPIVLHEGEP